MKTVETDVLIVGGGIAGSALACALRDTGYWVVLVDHRTKPLDTALGDHLPPSAVETLSSWGVLDRLLEKGAGRRVGHEFRTAAGETLLKADYSELPIAFPYFLVFHHDLFADALLEIAQEGSNFELFKPSTALTFKLRGDRVRSVTVQVGDEEILIKPHIVVGADGTNSVVRNALDIKTVGHRYQHRLGVLLGPRPRRLRPDEYAFRFSGPEGVVSIQARMDERIKLTMPIGLDASGWWEDSSKEQRAEALGARASILEGFDSELAGVYPVCMAQAQEYVRGNTVLVGDAAQTLHPVRGQGMNLAIAGLRHLLGCLPSVSDISSFDKVCLALARYQHEHKPLADRIVSRSHEAALAMESGAGENRAAFIAEQDAHIRQVHARPDLRRMHLMELTGYPLGAPLAKEPDYLA